ncbi:hypothetical protein [Hyalangium rubrum]|uniref:Lipoprotein n=1 Tax=Hyalangium rubrum TaxID=3103134 RepID=A0ABU5HG25_9BACT|nr:hypothetical protein [Hyalangium sp. s54d21]MDY7231762.1 hypothetical protein [Hyalangium sp. s54d21]
MAKHAWKGFMMAGLLGLTGLAVGCTERENSELREDTREMGQDIDNAADNAAQGVEDTARDVNNDLRDGTGGSGVNDDLNDDDVNIGDREGVINDGEGPFEQPNRVGEDNMLEDGKGPLEDNKNR